MFVIPYLSIDPVAFSVGPIKVHWYGVAYALGIILGWRYCVMLINHGRSPISKKNLDDFIPWATLGIILGGRLGEVLFYNPSYYFENPAKILALWNPGMSFHGGFTGVALATLLFCHYRKISILKFSDLLAAGTPIGLFFGRLANYINGELVGRVTDVSWGTVFPGAGPLPRHPSQLYEAILEGLFLFVLLGILSFKTSLPKKYPGVIGGIFLIGYAFSRCVSELFREPDPHIGYLIGGTTTGQWLSFPLFIVGAVLIALSFKKNDLTSKS